MIQTGMTLDVDLELILLNAETYAKNYLVLQSPAIHAFYITQQVQWAGFL
jgi:hypothetical protein